MMALPAHRHTDPTPSPELWSNPPSRNVQVGDDASAMIPLSFVLHEGKRNSPGCLSSTGPGERAYA